MQTEIFKISGAKEARVDMDGAKRYIIIYSGGVAIAGFLTRARAGNTATVKRLARFLGQLSPNQQANEEVMQRVIL